MGSLLEGLNDAQAAAVTSAADVLQILAPPGSGKTKTLTSRVAYLLHERKYRPWNVICLTFTIKSAREMKDRIARLLGHGVEKKIVLGTFHSICRRYLVSYGHLIGLAKGFGIADSSDTISIIRRIVKRERLSLDPRKAQSRISSSKSKGMGLQDIVQKFTKKKDVEQQEFIIVFEAYQQYLVLSNLLDYDDLLLRCAELLQWYPSCVSNVEAVLVDEFQDTNVVQFDLMRLFANQSRRITTVGDPDQSIYGWRSAEIKNLERMQELYPDTLVIHLQDNYRSSGAILFAAQEVIDQDESRPQKCLAPTHPLGTVPVLRRVPSAEAEASWVVSEIQRMIVMTGHLFRYSDFAILLRSASLSRLLESALGKSGIPYQMIGGQRFFDRVEVKILLDYLRVVSQPTNSDALVRIVNTPARGIGATTVKALLEEAEKKKVTLWTLMQRILRCGTIETKISKSAKQGLSTFTNLIITANRKILGTDSALSPEALLLHIINKLDFQAYLSKSYPEDHEAKWANVEELVAQASEYPILNHDGNLDADDDDGLPVIDGIDQVTEDVGQEALSKFLANVALATELQREKEDAKESNVSSQVTISTIHGAKGLEWPVVFVPSAYDGCIPHSRAEDTDEERRLLYVAMTRAQALLYMSCPFQNSQKESTTLSQFLSPKEVGRFLTNQGPAMTMSTTSEIARILRRECPDQRSVEDEVQNLRSRYDDLWPLKRVDKGESTFGRWKIGHEEGSDRVRCKRRWDGDADFMDVGSNEEKVNRHVLGNSITYMCGTTTMENHDNFTMSGLGGFSTAATKLHADRDRKMQALSRIAGDKHAETGRHSAKRQHEQPSSIADDKGSLLSMWGIKQMSADKPNLVTMAEEANIRTTSARTAQPSKETARHRSSQDPLSRPGQIMREPLAAIPQDLALHRIPPITKPKQPTYVLLSSSPPPTDSVQQEVEAQSQDSTGCRAKTSKQAKVFHTTTISLLKQRASPPRKTLGLRRGMNGWQAKSGQGFSVPS